jgi:hypothetical protein
VRKYCGGSAPAQVEGIIETVPSLTDGNHILLLDMHHYGVVTGFSAKAYFQIIIESLKHCRLHKEFFLLGYVIMPTHLHHITSNREGVLLSDIMRDFRTYTSRRIQKQLEADKREGYFQIFEKSASKLDK